MNDGELDLLINELK